MCIRDRFNIPLDEYPRRCIKQIAEWEEERNNILKDGKITHERSREYASYIMEAVVTNKPYQIGGNVLNTGLIDNLPSDACVEAVSYTHLDVYKRQIQNIMVKNLIFTTFRHTHRKVWFVL